MEKATHDGDCQCCGSRQRLPNGVLAKHGYTIQSGFFEGTCMGSGELPFQQSKDLIEKFIEQALNRRQKLVEWIEKLKQPATEAQAWVNEYDPRFRKIMGTPYHWVMRPLYYHDTRFNPYSTDIGWDAPEGSGGISRYQGVRYERGRSWDPEMNTLKDRYSVEKRILLAATTSNREYAKHLSKDVAKIDEYVIWQRRRIEGWKPTPLLERSR